MVKRPDAEKMLQTLQEQKLIVNPYYRHKQALLVQQDMHSSDSAFFIDDMLQSRGYEVSTTSPENCTKEYVLAAIDELADKSRDDSRTLFYYSGHGFLSDGITTIVDLYPEGIEPLELFSRLGRVRGKKAAIVDACLSGEFTDYLRRTYCPVPLITDYVVIASTQRKGLSFSGTIDVPNESRLKGRSISNVVYWMWTNHCEYGIFYLDKWPLMDFTIPSEEAEKLAQMFPHIDVGQLSLEMQRISDTDFEL